MFWIGLLVGGCAGTAAGFLLAACFSVSRISVLEETICELRRRLA